MKIAVTSQNKREITEHAGKCRKFWIYEIDEGKIGNKHLLELSLEQSLHESPLDKFHPLEDIKILITGGVGAGLQQRLIRRGIKTIVTSEKEPDRAILAYLAGTLERLSPRHFLHHDEQVMS